MIQRVFNNKGGVFGWLLIVIFLIGICIVTFNLISLSGSSDSSILTTIEVDTAVKLHENVTHYKISGSSEEQLREQMNQKGPMGYDGHTGWYLKWDDDEKLDNASCSLQNSQVNLDIKITLPKWDANESNSESLKEKWRDFEQKLTEHELEHRKLAIESANKLAKILNNLSSTTCEELKQLVNSEGAKILNEMRANDSKFDSETNHGKNRGAVFP